MAFQSELTHHFFTKMRVTPCAAMQALRAGVIAILLGAAAARVSLPGCPETCGNICIPYPFGIGPGCFREGFSLTCSNSSNPPTLTLGDGIQVLSISLPEGVVRINSNRFTFFANSDAHPVSLYGLLEDGPYTISATRNRFVAVGCDIFATITTHDALLDVFTFVTTNNTSWHVKYIGFCSSMCIDKSDNYDVQGGVCSGISCCQIPITAAVKNFNVNITHLNTTQSTLSDPALMPSKAFVVEKYSYKFSPGDLNSSRHDWESRVIPAVLDWTIKDLACDGLANYMMLKKWCRKKIKGGSCEISKSLPSFACRSNHSQCYNSNDQDYNFETERRGYRCNCSQGYQGNPYLAGGCEDIDECSAPDKYGCHGTCVNLPGTYQCFCPEGTYAISTNSTSPPKIHKCIPISIPISKFGTGKFLTGVGISIGVALLLLVIALLSQKLKVRRAKKLKERYFKQNKGLLLQQLISSNQDAADRVKIFTSEELEKATNSFDRTRILGEGGHGTVYKGILLDQRVVAIKRVVAINSNKNVQTEIDQFINEVAILSQINHRNIVKLFGCCLETEVPLLVYEFVSNGTLSQHLHAANGLSLSWDDRLRIATETARALAYLHTAASLSVFHRDVKSANILLNDALTAKVSDFGASRSVPLDHTRINTAIQGTFGYLDPEYFATGQLTEKSDVYSFGVILVELLTGQKAVSKNIVLEGRNLATHFLFSLKENCHSEILEARVVEEGGEAELESVANLAEMCLRLKGEERPTMKEVEVRLEALRGSKKKPQHTRDAQRLEYLQDPPMARKRSSVTTRVFSLEKEFLESASFPR